MDIFPLWTSLWWAVFQGGSGIFKSWRLLSSRVPELHYRPRGAEHGLKSSSPNPGAWSSVDYISLINSLQWRSRIKIAVTDTPCSNRAVDLTGLSRDSPHHQALQQPTSPLSSSETWETDLISAGRLIFYLISLAFCQCKNVLSEISNPFQWELKDNPRSSAQIFFASYFLTRGALLVPWRNGVTCTAVSVSWEMKEVLTCNSREGRQSRYLISWLCSEKVAAGPSTWDPSFSSASGKTTFFFQMSYPVK